MTTLCRIVSHSSTRQGIAASISSNLEITNWSSGKCLLIHERPIFSLSPSTNTGWSIPPTYCISEVILCRWSSWASPTQITLPWQKNLIVGLQSRSLLKNSPQGRAFLSCSHDSCAPLSQLCYSKASGASERRRLVNRTIMIFLLSLPTMVGSHCISNHKSETQSSSKL